MGPYPVGVRTVVITDPARFDPDTREMRTLVTEIWYPAAETARGQTGASYVLDDLIPAEFIPPEGTTAKVTTPAVRDAAPYDADEPFPAVVFSHGSGGVRQQSTFLTAVLASHGYVVAAPDHTGNTLRDLVVAGDLEAGAMVAAYDDRPRDVSRVIDWLGKRPDDDPLAGLVDVSRVGVVGHSAPIVVSRIG